MRVGKVTFKVFSLFLAISLRILAPQRIGFGGGRDTGGL